MKCFVICPIGDSGSETRKQSDDLLEYIISETLRPLGFEIERADTIAESGLITSQIIERVTSADLVVADLSKHNANVFYELAIRHVTGKPFVQLIEKNERIPFDVANSRTILYSLDLSGAKRAREELLLQVQNILEGKGVTENPISVAIDLRALASSEDPVKTALLRIESEISAFRATVEKLATLNRYPLKTMENLDLLIASGARLTVAELIQRMSENSDEMENPSRWTDERVEILKSMWESGSSATEIAHRLGGLTRNAVIGKIHRLGLGSRPPVEPDDN